MVDETEGAKRLNVESELRTVYSSLSPRRPRAPFASLPPHSLPLAPSLLPGGVHPPATSPVPEGRSICFSNPAPPVSAHREFYLFFPLALFPSVTTPTRRFAPPPPSRGFRLAPPALIFFAAIFVISGHPTTQQRFAPTSAAAFYLFLDRRKGTFYPLAGVGEWCRVG